MTITYPRALPSSMVISDCTPRIHSAIGMTTSPFTFAQQVHAFPGQRFGFDISVAPSEEADAGPLRAFLASMNGREKTCLFGDPMRTTARGAAGTTPGTPQVKGGSQTGSTLLCDDAGQTNITGYLLEGDYIQLFTGSSSRLHMVLEDADIDGSGNFTLNLFPSLRESPTDNLAIGVTTPQGVFRLSDNQQTWNESTVISGFQFSLMEAI